MFDLLLQTDPGPIIDQVAEVITGIVIPALIAALRGL